MGARFIASSEPIPLDQIDRMWGPAAETLLRHISPYHVALSVYDTNPDEAKKIADYIIRYYPENDENVAWARVILGMRHEAYLQYGKAREEVRDRLAASPRSPDGRHSGGCRCGLRFVGSRPMRRARSSVSGQCCSNSVNFEQRSMPLNKRSRWIRPIQQQGTSSVWPERNSTPENPGGDFDEANRLLRKAIQDYDRQGGAGSGAATLHLSLGGALQQQGREGAEVEFKRAMQLDSSDRYAPAAYCALSSEIFRRDYDFCLSSLQRAPADALGQIVLMSYLSEMGNKSEAIKVMLNAIDHDNRRPQLHHALGNLYTQEKEWDEAKLSLLKAIELAPEAAVQHNNLGTMHYNMGEFFDAERAYSAATKYNPHTAQYRNNLGAALRELKQFDRATVEYQKAIELEPENADHYHGLGRVFVSEQRLRQRCEGLWQGGRYRAPHRCLSHQPGSRFAGAEAVRPRDRGIPKGHRTGADKCASL